MTSELTTLPQVTSFSFERINLRKRMNNEEAPSNFLFRSIQNNSSSVLIWKSKSSPKYLRRQREDGRRSAWPSRFIIIKRGSQVYAKISTWLRNQFCTQSFRIKIICFYLCRSFPASRVRDRTDLYPLIGRSALLDQIIQILGTRLPSRSEIGPDTHK